MNLLKEFENLTKALEGASRNLPESDSELHQELKMLTVAARGCMKNLAIATPTPCRTCRYHFGETVGPTTIECALHPSGPDNNQCPDWEETTN